MNGSQTGAFGSSREETETSTVNRVSFLYFISLYCIHTNELIIQDVLSEEKRKVIRLFFLATNALLYNDLVNIGSFLKKGKPNRALEPTHDH
jgi:hypothetical protein